MTITQGCWQGGGLAWTKPTGRNTDPRGAQLEFDSEVVRLFVEADSLEVEGVYRFLCYPSDVEFMGLYFPYPADSLLGEAHTVCVEYRAQGGPWSPMEFIEMPQGVGARWKVPLNLADTLEVRTVYRQALLASYARYIVTTTSAWRNPLTYARFEIHLPKGARPLELSFPFKPKTLDGRTVYVYEASDFMPTRDVTVRWVHDEER